MLLNVSSTLLNVLEFRVVNVLEFRAARRSYMFLNLVAMLLKCS